MNNRLTKSQERVFNCIKKFINDKNYSPSVRDLCKMTKKKSPATIKATLDILKRKEYITFIPGKARTIRIIKKIN